VCAARFAMAESTASLASAESTEATGSTASAELPASVDPRPPTDAGRRSGGRVSHPAVSGYAGWGKRGLDLLLLVLLALPALALLVVAAALVRWRDGAPVFFVQVRPGLDGRPFRLRKLRTMRPLLPGEPGGSASDAVRLTPTGRWLRRTSLDELPQLWNVLRGEMSFVGPRPLLLEYLPRYRPEQARRHQVRPGLTGYAQVSGRNASSWEERLAQDVWYVDHLSLGLDLAILWRTVAAVVSGRGVAAEGHASMPELGVPAAAGEPGQVPDRVPVEKPGQMLLEVPEQVPEQGPGQMREPVSPWSSQASVPHPVPEQAPGRMPGPGPGGAPGGVQTGLAGEPAAGAPTAEPGRRVR
jgi:sugar transferase EpsL